MKNERALVLGGGGITGIAWESGVLAALIENGMKISQIDKIFGTSAGAFVGAVLSNNQDMKSYYHYLNENKDPNEQTKLKKEVYEMWRQAYIQGGNNQESIGRLLGEMIDQVQPVISMKERKKAIAKRLNDSKWTSQLVITAINARTGQLETINQQIGMDLIDSVAASEAVPGLWPHVTMNGKDYIDGGMVSSTNACLAKDFKQILIIAPLTQKIGKLPNVFDDEITLSNTSDVYTITPDEFSKSIIGDNIYDASVIIEVGNAGYEQGKRLVKEIEALMPEWLS
ncbi:MULTISPECIES: patatin-like phospholipase family protein [Staphylococcus]|uniref:patatin-like phospholipase family protein n=1 Tax=Staphylococcus TaxID=1279 RepID=UPI000246393F|nr:MULTISPECIES: patatin-like phospholipase family protein [Staphylococcus]QAV31167.1 phospholipase [Sulfitobacter donghicola]AGZ26048.1 putative patatin [Staphylococcus pasteuri SP1]KAB7646778.1 patatin-like phospholipase family protein [Staphylococcus sp. B2-b]MBN6853613.1 patatin-like phospholipase family protein [Staphylococcus warneri]MBT2768764.1 patatin-like phospholipase family protein [Staphylococcus warneri]